MLRLFVYGTLKKGGRYHNRFCRGAAAIETAAVWGRLYLLPEGFPALVVPGSRILAHGTADPLADAALQVRTQPGGFDRPEGDWDLVQGELISFIDPLRDLPPIDRLEDFRPGRGGTYRRVMAAARVGDAIRPAWLYTITPRSRLKRIAAGRWNSR